MFEKIVKIILLSIILFNSMIYANNVGIGPNSRTQDIGEFMITSDRPSDLPVAGFSEFFDKENINIFKNMDLTSYTNMKIFAGYGLYDPAQDNCQFIEVPNKSKSDFETNFQDFLKFNKHTYAKTINRMNYSQCLSKASEYGGTPVIIDSSSENYFIKRNYSNSNSSWIGATIADCTSIYLSAIQKTQFFTNFREDTICESNKKNLIQNKFGYWEKVNSSDVYNCVIEWDSEEFFRPIKVCAPWWRVGREFKNPSIGPYSQRELNRINQASIPQTLDICTQYDTNATAIINPEVGRDVTCTTYYSATIAPECFFDSHQAQCFVDECGGYIRNACRLKFEEVVGKGYIKGQVIHDGVKVSIKVKDEVKTNVFTCPPSPYSMSDCLKKSQVIIYPKECTRGGSNCEGLKACLYSALTEDEITTCENTYSCEKIYASRDFLPDIDSNGIVTALHGKCSDGEMLDFEPNILGTNERRCLEYDQVEIVENSIEKCLLDRNYQDHRVNVAFTSSDAYEDEPNCLRIDTVEDSQVDTPITVNLSSNGYFKHKITRVFIDDRRENLYIGGDDSYMLDVMNGGTETTSVESNSTSTSSCNLNLNCNSYIDQSYIDRVKAILMDGSYPDRNVDEIIISTSESFVYVSGLSTQDSCNDYASYHGFSSYTDSTRQPRWETWQAGTTRCTIYLNHGSYDSHFDRIALAGGNIEYHWRRSISKKSCMENAICINGAYNESAYGTSFSSTAVCSVVSQPTGSPEEYLESLQVLANCDIPPEPLPTNTGTCEPAHRSAQLNTILNGFESILVFEDYLTGIFGYYSNFMSRLPKSNFATVSGGSQTNKEIFPLVKLSRVADIERYAAHIAHYSHRNKQVDTIGEVAIGLSAVTSTIVGGPITGALATAVVFVIVALLTPSRAMDSQDMEWVIYKQPPTSDFSRFDNRKLVRSDRIVGSSVHVPTPINLANATTIPGNDNYLTYIEGYHSIPRQDPGNYRGVLANALEAKKATLYCSGYDTPTVESMIHRAERSTIGGYPSCKWYNLWCTKKNAYVYDPNIEVSKLTNTIYSGADETVTFLLPYTGDFRVIGYDKYETVIGDLNISESDFINTVSSSQLNFAQVKLGTTMSIAPGVAPGSACFNDYMVEVGGGISGVYQEMGTTGDNIGCGKSNNTYVNDHSIVKIEVIPANMPNARFTFWTKKPLPFPNRIFLATLGKKQEREYRCYDEFGDCLETDFVAEE